MRKLISVLALFLTACGGGVTLPDGTVIPPVSTTYNSNCNLKTYNTTYPNEYLGSNSIPTPTQRFDSTIKRMIGLKDYYPYDNNNCATQIEYTRLLYKKTLDRLQTLGVDTVEIYQYGPVNDFNSPVWSVNASRLQIPESELTWFFQEAHRRNLKVTLVWQLWNVDALNNTINTTNPTEAEMVKVIRGWGNVIKSMAIVSAENKVDNLLIQWSAFHYPIVSSYPETATREFLSIISDIRTVYSGKLFMGTPRFYDKRIIEKVDAIVIPLAPSNWSYMDDVNMSVSLLKQRYSDAIAGIYLDFSLYTGMDPKTIPIIWDFNIQSRDKALSQGWVEDGFCIDSSSNIVPFTSLSCVQKNYVTDFSVQAMAIEGAFQAIKDQSYFKTYGVNFSTGYWHTDNLVASDEGFPNLSQSIRGKPAENIVKAWFQK